MALEAEILSDLAAAEQIRPDWQRLAAAAAEPFSGPGWALAWWRHASPGGAALRILTVRDGGALVGVAPLWAAAEASRSSRYEALGGRLASPAGPIALPGREAEVASALAASLAALRPRVSQLELEGLSSRRWASRLASSLPGRPGWVLVRETRPFPVVEVEGLGDYDAWLAAKTSNFRNQARRLRRRLEEAGADFGSVGPDELAATVEEFERLHASRRDGPEGSNALVPGLREMLAELGASGLGDDGLRVYRIRAEERAIAVTIALAAGGTVEAWNSGFDQDWYKLSPSQQLNLFAIEDAIARGDSRFRLGAGDAGYKLRLADRMDEISREAILPRGRSYPLARIRLAPTQARRFAGDRLSDEAKARIRRLSGRR